jgi:hypothetical protein
MPGKVAKIGTFSDWIGLFNDWRKDIGVNTADIDAFHFDTLYGAIDTEEIEFGSYKGRRKWENLRQIPTQQMRDALMNMIVYQGDTEFASVEQQRNLLENAPTDWDRRAITRVMIEEMRHGWQMCALLIDHFGYSGKVEAQKMLERRAFENKRLLGAFNVDVDNWMDFFTYTDFEVFGVRAAGPLHVVYAARGSVSHGHGQRWPAAHRGSGRDSGLADPEISQQVDFQLLRSVRHRSFLVGALGVCVGC